MKNKKEDRNEVETDTNGLRELKEEMTRMTEQADAKENMMRNKKTGP